MGEQHAWDFSAPQFSNMSRASDARVVSESSTPVAPESRRLSGWRLKESRRLRCAAERRCFRTEKVLQGPWHRELYQIHYERMGEQHAWDFSGQGDAGGKKRQLGV